MAGKSIDFRRFLKRTLPLLLGLLLFFNLSVYLTPYFIPTSYQVGELYNEITLPTPYENPNPVSFSTYNDQIFTIQQTKLVVYNAETEILWDLDLSISFTLLPVELNRIEILEVSENGVYIYYSKRVNDAIILTIGLFDEAGIVNEWDLYSINNDDTIDTSQIINVIKSVHLTTAVGNPIVSLLYHAYSTTNSTIQTCNSFVYMLNPDELLLIQSQLSNQCENFYYHTFPESYIINNQLFISSTTDNLTQSSIYLYDETTNTLIPDSTLLDPLDVIENQYSDLALEGYFTTDDQIYTLWYYKDAAIPDYDGSRLFYIFEGDRVVQSIDLNELYEPLSGQYFNNFELLKDIRDQIGTGALFQLQQVDVFSLYPDVYSFPATIRDGISTSLVIFEFDVSDIGLSYSNVNISNRLDQFQLFTSSGLLNNEYLVLNSHAFEDSIISNIIEIYTLDPVNFASWINQQSVLFIYIIPSLILTAVIVIIQYMRSPRIPDQTNLYPTGDTE